MKIFIAVRLYSGFHDSIGRGSWAPTGAPTIYKLLETLCASEHEVELTFTCKENIDGFDTGTDRDIFIEGLEQPAHILAGEAYVANWPRRLQWYLSEIRQTRRLLSFVKQSRPDLIYVDRGNLWAASALAKHSQTPVVYRIMGVSPSLKSAFDGNRPHQILTRRQLASPFELVICSLDGSGGEVWLDRILKPEVLRVVALNGVDLPMAETESPHEAAPRPTTILFLGRLDPIKGCDNFLAAFHQAFSKAPGKLRAVIVGEGPNKQSLRRTTAKWGLQDAVSFTGALHHDDVLAQLKQADIYVSLNRMGNLSNANLEAMRSGCCMIIPASRPTDCVDAATAQMFPADVICRINNADDIDVLSQTILRLHANPEERKARGRATARLAREIIPSWRKRIDAEVRLLELLAARRGRTALQQAIVDLEWSAINRQH